MKVRNVLKRVTTKVRGFGISGLVDAAITRAKGIVKQRQA
jgi:hypothetical protein